MGGGFLQAVAGGSRGIHWFQGVCGMTLRRSVHPGARLGLPSLSVVAGGTAAVRIQFSIF